MKNTFSLPVISLLVFTWLAATPASAQETAGQILAKLEKLSAENRQKVLVERARSEKEVTFYSSLQTADAEPYVKAFNKRYPFHQGQHLPYLRAEAGDHDPTEFNAGRHAFDVTNASAAQAFGIKKTGALDPYQSSPAAILFATPIRIRKDTSLRLISSPWCLATTPTWSSAMKRPNAMKICWSPNGRAI